MGNFIQFFGPRMLEPQEQAWNMASEITITAPDDWHLHLRDGCVLPHTVAHAERQFQRAIVMPNLRPPVRTTDDAAAYRERILACLGPDSTFNPLMTLYMTDTTSAEEIRRAKDSGIVHAVKLYPAGATTNSDSGVTNIEHIKPALRAMSEVGMPLLVHGEVTHDHIDIFDRERQFIEEVLKPLVVEYPDLKVVMEHITTQDAVEFVQQASANVAATITCHHLLHNRNDIFVGGIRPHMYCLPILKRESHRQALLAAATSGSPKFFLGTDSAPHAVTAKLSSCGCAGIFTGHAAVALYAEAFESIQALDRLEDFASHFGADFYGLPRNEGTITLRKEPWTVLETYELGESTVVPLRAGQEVAWRIVRKDPFL